MPTVRLTRRLWLEAQRQNRSQAARRAAEARWRKRAEQRQNALIEAHMHVVEKIAKTVHRMLTHVEFADLVAAGYLGLVEAARRFDPSAGAFEPYAYFRVRGAMIDAHKRRAYRDETHDSIEGISERMGFLPAYLSTDPGPRPDEIVEAHELEVRAVAAIHALPEDQRAVLLDALGGTPLAEAAAARGRSVAWARAKLAQARATVAEAVRQERLAA